MLLFSIILMLSRKSGHNGDYHIDQAARITASARFLDGLATSMMITTKRGAQFDERRLPLDSPPTSFYLPASARTREPPPPILR